MESGDSLVVNGSIQSFTASATPGKINLTEVGTQRKLHNSTHNLYVESSVETQYIDADISGVLHAPEGTDGGNNNNIDFSNSAVLTPLDWIAGHGEWNVRDNWPNVSGGCPVDKDPNTALRLILDDSSFFDSQDIITVPIFTNCKTLDFYNTTFPAGFDIQTRMNPLQVIINGATVPMTGAKMYVQTKTELRNNSTVYIDNNSGIDPKYDPETLHVTWHS